MEEFNYKETKVNLGFSDIAQIHCTYFLRGGEETKVKFINFSGDGDYAAYVINEGDPVPEHYKEVVDLSNASWVNVYDDVKLRVKIYGGVRFYRAGQYGCLIVLSKNATIAEYKEYVE